MIGNELTRTNVINTFSQLLRLGVIPIVNENDTVATDELEGANIGDNDTLSAYVAKLVTADFLILITDTDGLYDRDPSSTSDTTEQNCTDPESAVPKLLHDVTEITPEIEAMAGKPSSSFGTGGMATKIAAAKISKDAGIPCAIVSGHDPNNLYRIFDGEEIGTIFW